MQQTAALLLFMVSGVLFALVLHAMTQPVSARRGPWLAAAGLALALLTALAVAGVGAAGWLTVASGLAIGAFAGLRFASGAKTKTVPGLVAGLNAAAGLAALLVAAAAFDAPDRFGIDVVGGLALVEIALAAAFGSVAFAGSATTVWIARRTQGARAPLPGRLWLEGGVVAMLVVLTAMLATTGRGYVFGVIVFEALALGILSALPARRTGAKAAALYGSCAGWATAAMGFVAGNPALIIAGALVGSACLNLARRRERPERLDVPAEPVGTLSKARKKKEA